MVVALFGTKANILSLPQALKLQIKAEKFFVDGVASVFLLLPCADKEWERSLFCMRIVLKKSTFKYMYTHTFGLSLLSFKAS